MSVGTDTKVAGDQLFNLDKPAEIITLLQRLMDRRCLLSVHMDGRTDSFLTALLDVPATGGRLLLDASADPECDRAIGQARTLLFHTQMDQVEVRFRTGTATPVLLNGIRAYHVPVPTQVYYLQQREYYRLAVPIARPVICEIAVAPEPAEAAVVQVRARAFDISVGGVGLSLTPADADLLPVGSVQQACRLTLPDSGDICPHLRICHLRTLRDARGNQRVHAGCQFVGVRPALQAVVQRYIMRVERERIARDRGMT